MVLDDDKEVAAHGNTAVAVLIKNDKAVDVLIRVLRMAYTSRLNRLAAQSAHGQLKLHVAPPAKPIQA